MKQRLTEGSILFVSIIKWVILATIIGIIGGLASTIFLKLLVKSIAISYNYQYYFLALPVALFFSAIITKYIAPDVKGDGTDKVIEAVHKNSGKIKAAVVPAKLVATIATLVAGGSVGKEGPCAQMGAGLASIFASIFRFNSSDYKKLVICGVSAGFASVFGTPIGGAIFGVEFLFVGNILYDVLLASFISGVVAYHVSSSFGIEYFHHPIAFIPVFSSAFFAKVILAGILFGILSFFTIELLEFIEKISGKIKVWEPFKGIIGGLVLVGLTLIFSTQYLGLGLNTIESCLKGDDIVWYAFFLKIIFTGISLSFCGSGGIVTPIFFIGAAAGTLLADIMGLDKATFAAVGFVSLLSGTTNTPIASSIMSIELFGPKIAPYAAVSCVVSFLMTGHRSVHPSQVLAMKKSQSIGVEMGKEIEDVNVQFRPRGKSLIGVSSRLVKKVKEAFKQHK